MIYVYYDEQQRIKMKSEVRLEAPGLSEAQVEDFEITPDAIPFYRANQVVLELSPEAAAKEGLKQEILNARSLDDLKKFLMASI